jgi:hypothetical protein
MRGKYEEKRDVRRLICWTAQSGCADTPCYSESATYLPTLGDVVRLEAEMTSDGAVDGIASILFDKMYNSVS